MGRVASTTGRIQALLADGKPRGSRDIAHELGCGDGATVQALRRAWEAGLVLRTEQPIHVTERRRRGRAGTSTHLRTYHLYSISTRENETSISNRKFVSFSRKYLDPRGGGGHSKARNLAESSPAPWTPQKRGQPPYPPKAMVTLLVLKTWLGIDYRSISVYLRAFPEQRIRIGLEKTPSHTAIRSHMLRLPETYLRKLNTQLTKPYQKGA